MSGELGAPYLRLLGLNHRLQKPASGAIRSPLSLQRTHKGCSRRRIDADRLHILISVCYTRATTSGLAFADSASALMLFR